MDKKSFIIYEEPLPDVYILGLPKACDNRGCFLKPFNSQNFKNLNLEFKPEEYFVTRSKKNVLRGMHFQINSSAHKKLVFCPIGHVLDVIVDVRHDSKYFNKPYTIELDEDNPKAILIGKGYAHGFLSLKNDTWMNYITSSVYDFDNDCGILWSSINFDWPTKNPILSFRDQNHPHIEYQKCKFS